MFVLDREKLTYQRAVLVAATTPPSTGHQRSIGILGASRRTCFLNWRRRCVTLIVRPGPLLANNVLSSLICGPASTDSGFFELFDYIDSITVTIIGMVGCCHQFLEQLPLFVAPVVAATYAVVAAEKTETVRVWLSESERNFRFQEKGLRAKPDLKKPKSNVIELEPEPGSF